MKTSFITEFLPRDPSPEILKYCQESPFEDCAKTHTFSDWLLAFSFNYGYDPDTSYPLGALPDLNLNIDEVQKRERLPLAEFFSENMPGKYFIDLGCGDPQLSRAPQILSQIFQAKMYIGVDSKHISKNHEIHEGPLTKTFLKMDLLEFVARLELSMPKIFFLGGIDPKSDSENLISYLMQLREELSRVCIQGDLIILGAGSTGLELEQAPRHFECIYRDFFHEISRCSD